MLLRSVAAMVTNLQVVKIYVHEALKPLFTLPATKKHSTSEPYGRKRGSDYAISYLSSIMKVSFLKYTVQSYQCLVLTPHMSLCKTMLMISNLVLMEGRKGRRDI